MIVKQVELEETNGGKHVCWIDAENAVLGYVMTLKLGDGQFTEPAKVIHVWDIIRDLAEIQERETNHRSFGGSIK